MIESAEEFVRLRCSTEPSEYQRAAWEAASEEVWLEVIHAFPHMKFWVAHNKRLPETILRLLATVPEEKVRSMIAMKRASPPDVLEHLAQDESSSVRHSVTMNAKTPAYLLKELMADEEEFIRAAARERLTEHD